MFSNSKTFAFAASYVPREGMSMNMDRKEAKATFSTQFS
jgi:hypothetical protein